MNAFLTIVGLGGAHARPSLRAEEIVFVVADLLLAHPTVTCPLELRDFGTSYLRMLKAAGEKAEACTIVLSGIAEEGKCRPRHEPHHAKRDDTQPGPYLGEGARSLLL